MNFRLGCTLNRNDSIANIVDELPLYDAPHFFYGMLTQKVQKENILNGRTFTEFSEFRESYKSPKHGLGSI